MNIVVIPARGGSKRIPRKNIRDFMGQPIISHAIHVAKKSQLFDQIIVSTDDAEIAAISRQWGASTPFERPAELANDFAGTTEVIAHGTEWAIAQGWALEAVCCLYATAPFVEVADLVAGWQALQSGEWSYAFSVTDFASPIFRSFRQTEKGGVEMFFPEHFTKRSQDLPIALHDAGQFYWGRPQAWLKQKRIFEHHSIPVLIPRDRVVDIDTEEDWRQAELMWHVMKRKKNAK